MVMNMQPFCSVFFLTCKNPQIKLIQLVLSSTAQQAVPGSFEVLSLKHILSHTTAQTEERDAAACSCCCYRISQSL